MVKPKKPLNEYSKANWGDHIETREGWTICITSTSNLIAIVLKLEKDRGFKNPEGTVEGYGRVGVRVQMLLPSSNPYPWWGYWEYQGYQRGIV